MVARQEHGFINEAKVCETKNIVKWGDFVKIYPQYSKRQQGYTSVWDGIDMSVKTEGEYGFLPVQIKTIKKGAAVELGDIFRNSKKNEVFRLIVDFYDKNDKSKTKMVETVDIIVDPVKWQAHFNFPDYDEWKSWIKGVSNCSSYTETWIREREARKQDWNIKNPDSLVTPTFKRDSKKQKRIQCSVNRTNFNKFIESIEQK